MQQTLHDKVWSYKQFSELTPEAAKKAIQDDRLFALDLTWAKCMDPLKVNNLYHSDGRLVRLTTQERDIRFPKRVH